MLWQEVKLRTCYLPKINDKKSCQNILTKKVVNAIVRMTKKVVKKKQIEKRKCYEPESRSTDQAFWRKDSG